MPLSDFEALVVSLFFTTIIVGCSLILKIYEARVPRSRARGVPTQFFSVHRPYRYGELLESAKDLDKNHKDLI